MGQQAGCSYIMTLLQAKSKKNFPIGDFNKKIDPFNIILPVMAQFDIMLGIRTVLLFEMCFEKRCIYIKQVVRETSI